MRLFLPDPEATEAFGARLWPLLPASALIFLYGQLGAGKTSLVRGLLRAGGFSGTVKSPTYNLVEEYNIDGRMFFHFDLYRLKDPEELEWIGMHDYLHQSAICLIEWPEQGGSVLPKADLELRMNLTGQGRQLELTAGSESFADLIKRI